VLAYPSYSLDLVSAELNIAMSRTKFKAVSSIQQTVTRELKAVREEACSRAFDSLYERCPRCAEGGGAYIEQWK
jgi:hypothetical protein